ncbi:hypothetical protein ACVBEH_05900 [Roseateles sp. GG27B]
MKLFIDSADVKSWTLPRGCPLVQGVTTNPSLIHQAGLPVTLATYLQLLQAAGEHALPELMLQPPAPTRSKPANGWPHCSRPPPPQKSD